MTIFHSLFLSATSLVLAPSLVTKWKQDAHSSYFTSPHNFKLKRRAYVCPPEIPGKVSLGTSTLSYYTLIPEAALLKEGL
jgi:hypothetical protein